MRSSGRAFGASSPPERIASTRSFPEGAIALLGVL